VRCFVHRALEQIMRALQSLALRTCGIGTGKLAAAATFG
jgi:hypothetical protein